MTITEAVLLAIRERASSIVEAGTLESAVEQHLVSNVEARGGIAVKMLVKDWPDRLVIWPPYAGAWGRYHDARFHLVETKRPKGGRLRSGQKRMIARLNRDFEVDVYVLSTVKAVDAYLRDEANVYSVKQYD